jgi:hypothetical protein
MKKVIVCFYREKSSVVSGPNMIKDLENRIE